MRMRRIPISRAFLNAIGHQPRLEAAPLSPPEATTSSDLSCAAWASGEKPYTLVMVWRVAVVTAWPTLDLALIATEADEMMITPSRWTRSTRRSDWSAVTNRGRWFWLHGC
jgi:hypothetical protein